MIFMRRIILYLKGKRSLIHFERYSLRMNERTCITVVKPKFFESSAKSFQVDNRSLVVISEVLFTTGCYIVFILKRRGWIQGKNHLNSRTNSLQLGETNAGQCYPFSLNSHLTSFTKKVSQVLDIEFKQAWWRWKVKSNIYKVMFHDIWLVSMFTRSKRATKGRLQSWMKIKAIIQQGKTWLLYWRF